ncbi:TetR/AcrR family transcriptional regulator [Microbacterium album]|uniref:HTH-type transcriptional regulator PksA n=1 Tax=Microbacterium album TaxID=2053191 RepID=A0A917IFW0_9MICO|nr:TetR/AcrR family transcriptional regulator [Microbacterium album]GGH45446.1 HTH-type transcriptional regulator PksA [Microbacterium album]
MTEESRTRVLDAVVRVLAEQGVDRLRIRAVAEEAGLSVGAVQHAYATRNDLVHAAMQHVSERFTARLLSAVERDRAPQENLIAVSRLLAGVDEDARQSTVVWLAFTSLACNDPVIAESHRSAWRTLEHGLLLLLTQAAPHASADDAAELLALLDGLAIARATEPERMPSERAARIATRHVARLCARSG